ncbi:hypothetical protein CHS0354_039823 [Potamilus streckersoni]|uniref:Uncharacterized protein n=1 Tax=Potamilus streckersoni TaxID=2493646 RepID=A0AAE0RM99_9BIVA|nr:hypothetical protein CHS0354_039823 [Potamilus streckersoni]
MLGMAFQMVSSALVTTIEDILVMVDTASGWAMVGTIVGTIFGTIRMIGTILDIVDMELGITTSNFDLTVNNIVCKRCHLLTKIIVLYPVASEGPTLMSTHKENFF